MVLDVFPQSWEVVRDSEEYLYGTGSGKTVAEADKHAMADLISKIVTNVTSQSDRTLTVNNVNGKLDERSQFEHSVHTYSQATLTNTNRRVLQNEPEVHVARWIAKAEIEKMFKLREQKAIDYVKAAERAEREGKADDVLWNYYSALTLLKSLQYPNAVMYSDDKGQQRVLTNLIKERMDETFYLLHASCDEIDGNDVKLFITYKGKPVNTVNYSYWDGADWTPHCGAKDGYGVAELRPGYDDKYLQLRWEYKHEAAANADPELRAVLESVTATPMPKSKVDVPLEKQSRKDRKMKELLMGATFTTNSLTMLQPPHPMGKKAKEYMPILKRMVEAVRQKDYLSVKNLFSSTGWDMFQKLMNYGKAKVLDSSDIRFFEANGNVVERGLRMSFSFANGVKKSFVEDVVLTFNSEQKIDNIAFGLGKTAEDDILNKGVWDEKSRIAIMSFLENYKTAYALKRLDYIKSVFDDDAVIITGTVIKTSKSFSMENQSTISQSGRNIIKYNRHTKDEYLHNLARCFDKNEYVNIHFADNEVKKLGNGGESYAIQISQDYYSSTYGDKGYLMLMVDMNQPDRPLIKLRTWQPDRDVRFAERYTPGDF